MKKLFIIAPVIFLLNFAQVSAKEIYFGSQFNEDFYVLDETYQKTGKGTWDSDRAFKIQIKIVNTKSGKMGYFWFDFFTGQSEYGRDWFLSVNGGTAKRMGYWTHPVPKIFDAYKGF